MAVVSTILQDRTGQVLGTWAVISRAPNLGLKTCWNCRCSCGFERTFRSDVLRRKTPECRACKVVDYTSLFWSHVQKTDNCWNWTAALHTRGYGAWVANGRMTKAHRYSWELHFGVIPGKLMVLHKCDNRICVRPDHLFLGTQADNMADMVAKDRQPRGERNRNAKLTASKVQAIRRLRTKGWLYKDIAHQFGVSATTARMAASKSWRHVK